MCSSDLRCAFKLVFIDGNLLIVARVTAIETDSVLLQVGQQFSSYQIDVRIVRVPTSRLGALRAWLPSS